MPLAAPIPFWQSEDRTTVSLYHGDCLQIMPRLPAESVHLIFADPPFNIGYEYDQYDDRKSKEEYLIWTAQWVKECVRLLTPTGSMWVSIGVHTQAEVKILLDKAGLYWRDTICWHYTFGPRQESKFTPSWVPIHYYTKSPTQWTWNTEEIRVPSARQLKYNDKRAKSNGKVPDNTWILLPGEYQDCFQDSHNSWLESRVCGTFKERTNHPCQMPMSLLERIIKVSSNTSLSPDGDLVFDPFVGSGTTTEAALKLGRRTAGIELSEGYLTECVVPRVQQYIDGAYTASAGRGQQGKAGCTTANTSNLAKP